MVSPWSVYSKHKLQIAVRPQDDQHRYVRILSVLQSNVAVTWESVSTIKESPQIEMARILVWLLRAMKTRQVSGTSCECQSANQVVLPTASDPDFLPGCQELMNSVYNYVMNNYGPLVLGSLRVTAVGGEPMISQVATIYLQLIHNPTSSDSVAPVRTLSPLIET